MLWVTQPQCQEHVHVFVDGSCSFPKNRLFSVAAAAAVVADMDCFGEGAKPSSSRDFGAQQSVKCTVSDCNYVVETANIPMSIVQDRSPHTWSMMTCGRYLTVSLRGLPARLHLVKNKAHNSLDNAADHFAKLRCHYNALADAAAKEAVKQSRLVSFAQVQALCSKQLQINKMMARFHSFLAECAALQLKAVQRQSQFETSVLDVRGSCFCHLAVMDASILDSLPYTKEFGKDSL